MSAHLPVTRHSLGRTFTAAALVLGLAGLAAACGQSRQQQ